MAKYGRKAQSSVKSAMHKKKQGTLHSGKGKKRVKSRKQAIAIGLSEAQKGSESATKAQEPVGGVDWLRIVHVGI